MGRGYFYFFAQVSLAGVDHTPRVNQTLHRAGDFDPECSIAAGKGTAK